MNTSLFSKTPAVTVLDNRGLSVRSIAYHRHPDSPDDTGERITHHQYDARGFLTQSADPRLHDTGRANVKYLSDLVGNALCTVSADVGTTVALNDAAGRLFMTVSNIDTADDDLEDRSQVVNRTWQYEGASLPGRLLSITEQVTGEAARVTERFTYAANTDEKSPEPGRTVRQPLRHSRSEADGQYCPDRCATLRHPPLAEGCGQPGYRGKLAG